MVTPFGARFKKRQSAAIEPNPNLVCVIVDCFVSANVIIDNATIQVGIPGRYFLAFGMPLPLPSV